MYALEFQRVNGRDHKPVQYRIDDDTPPVTELAALLEEAKRQGAHVATMSPGRYAMHLKSANQIWAVRIVEVGELDDTQRMPAITDDELDNLGKAV